MVFSYEKCELCGRKCSVNRKTELGFCKMNSDLYIARASLHMWEEPIVSGTNGSGTIFFSGCSLWCSYCQNQEISRGISGIKIDENRLSEIMLELQDKGAHNVNLVTPTHYAPSIKNAIINARKKGLNIPIVYNTSSYDTVETLMNLEDVVDVYLADFKYYRSGTAKRLSSAENYSDTARKAINEMVKQKGSVKLDENGLVRSGVIVRILLLPGHVAEAKLILKYLNKTYGDRIYISLMNQYTPVGKQDHPLDRKVTREEYRQLVDYADRLGVINAFTQEEGTCSESFIPLFDNTGVI